MLEGRRADAVLRLAALRRDHGAIVESARSVSTDDEHDPEGATIAFERAQLESLIDQTLRKIAELDDAIARLDGGTYGSCASCGAAIAAERLEARPSATTCVSCASR